MSADTRVTVREVAPGSGDAPVTEAMARLLVEGFREMAPEAWPTLDDARREVAEALVPGKIALVAVDGDGSVLGWIGAQPAYEGLSWELHPLVVSPHHRRRGVGRLLVRALEAAVLARTGGTTLFLGTDDVMELTTLGGVDVFPGVLDKLRDIRNLRGHPFEFYQRLGYEIVGILPGANGFGKPDIFMAKPLRAREHDG